MRIGTTPKPFNTLLIQQKFQKLTFLFFALPYYYLIRVITPNFKSFSSTKLLNNGTIYVFVRESRTIMNFHFVARSTLLRFNEKTEASKFGPSSRNT